MIDITCPWCEEEASLALAELQAHDASFTCADCGTTISFIEEPVELELAA